jgi:antitoxin (DNA-binding transcriptional repressor) of toxin-antitoxin stability system
MVVYNASEFKAKCLAILDQVHSTRETVTILKRGKPIAQLVPPVQQGSGYPQNDLRGSVRVLGDIVPPPLPADAWESEAGAT